MSTHEYFVPNEIFFGINNYRRQSKAKKSQKFKEPLMIRYLRVLTILCDTMLMGCGICLCIGGCFIFKQRFDLVKVLNAHQELGEAFTILGCIYCILATFGILGAGIHKECFLNMHNIGWLLILFANGIAIYFYLHYIHVYTKEELPEIFKLFPEIQSFLDSCKSTLNKQIDSFQCCCSSVNGDRCWLYRGIPVKEQVCKDNIYQKVEDFLQIVQYFVPSSMTIQALAMTFGYLVVSCKNRYNRISLKEALKV